MDEMETKWEYRQDSNDRYAETRSEDVYERPGTSSTVQWTASEYIAHEKDPSWIAALSVITIIVAAIIYFLTKDKSAVIIVASLAILMGVAAYKKPRSLVYILDNEGLQVGNKFYPYDYFRGFSAGPTGLLPSLTLIPARRFMVPISLYFDQSIAQRVVDIISSYLPVEQPVHDPIERLMNKIRF